MREVKGQSIPGEDDFVERLISPIRKHQDIPEIPRSRRFAHRPSPDKVFTQTSIADNGRRNKTIIDAVAKYGYIQQQIAAHLNAHYSTISNPARGMA